VAAVSLRKVSLCEPGHLSWAVVKAVDGMTPANSSPVGSTIYNGRVLFFILFILFVYFVDKATLCRIVILDREAHADSGSDTMVVPETVYGVCFLIILR
jgi:hypothetical protein